MIVLTFVKKKKIHGRAMIPCQDSPSVKVTYSASVTSPLPVVMSALQTGYEEADKGLRTYKFEQLTSIPSYLIAIAVGNLVGREIGPRSTVWCEPEMVEQAAWEFSVRKRIEEKKKKNTLFIGHRIICCYWRSIIDTL